jgi:hypothetical protein
MGIAQGEGIFAPLSSLFAALIAFLFEGLNTPDIDFLFPPFPDILSLRQ